MTKELQANVINYLRSNSNKSAREIARNLKENRREINIVLYSDPKIFLSIGSNPPLWFLSSTLESNKLPDEPISTATFTFSSKQENTQNKKLEKISEVIKFSKNESLEIRDLNLLIYQMYNLYKSGIAVPLNESNLEEIMTKAWVKLNIPPSFSKRFYKTLKENNLTVGANSVRDLFSSTSSNSELTLNLSLLIYLDGYVSLESIAQFASLGKLYSHPDFQTLHLKQNELEIASVIDDLEILHRRTNGETLDSIAVTYGLTRERIRQRQLNMSVYRVETSSVISRNKKKSSQDDIKLSTISQYILKYPGCTYDELEKTLNFPVSEIRRLTPNVLKKLIAPTRRNAHSSMANEEILDAIRLASTFEYPLSGPGFDDLINSQSVKCVSRVRILQIFGSWSGACELAGVESLTPVRMSYDRNWSEADLWEYLMDFLLSPQTSNSFKEYDNWARERTGDRPSSGTLRNYLGQWSEVLTIALLKLRDDPYNGKLKYKIESSVKNFDT